MTDAALAHFDHDGHLRAVCAGVAAARTGEDVRDSGVAHVKGDWFAPGKFFHAAAIADGESSQFEIMWSQLEPNPGRTTS